MILSELKVRVESSPFLSEEERKAWLKRLNAMTREELQVLAGFLEWAAEEKAVGDAIKNSGNGLIKKAFTAMNHNAYKRAKKVMLEQIEKDTDPKPQ